MKLKHYLEIVRAGELKALSPAEHAQSDRVVCAHINIGLIELTKRFSFLHKAHILETTDNTIYTLPSDVMSISACYDGNGSPIGINQSGWNDSIFTIASNKIQVPFAKANNAIEIIYRASPQFREEKWLEDKKELHLINYEYFEQDIDEIGEANCELMLPPALLEPLGAYIAWRATMATMATVPNDNKTMYSFFEASCNRVRFDESLTPEGVYAERLFALERKGLNTDIHSYNFNQQGSI